MPVGATPKQKQKNNKRKILLSLLILLLTLLIAAVAVFAYVSADFTVTNNVSFTAQNVNAHIEVNVLNAGEYIELYNNSFDIIADDPSETPYGMTIPPQVYAGTGMANAIVYIVTITNTGENPFSVNLADLPSYSNLTIIKEYYRGTSLVTNGVVLANGQVATVKVYALLNEVVDTQEEIVMTFTLSNYD